MYKLHPAARYPLRFLTAVCLLAGAVLFPEAAAQARDGPETRYIVKRKPEAASVQGGRPEAVDAGELRALLKDGRLEWYEADRTATLPDVFPEAENAASEADAKTGLSEAGKLSGAVSKWYDSKMWHLDMIGAERAFELGFTGQGVRIGVIDSGVSAHPALEGRVEAGWNYMDGTADTEDANGHGTAVCGLIAAGTAGSMIGAAPGATLIPLKCFRGTETSVSVIVSAIYGAVDDFHCDLINLSVGIPTDSAALREAVDYAAAKGVMIVAAVGNDGTGALYCPACYDAAVGVGSVDSTAAVYSLSNHNRSVFLTAPGASVVSTNWRGGEAAYSGTSYSVALVTAAAADLLSADPALSPPELQALLSETAADRGEPGCDEYYGYGILDLRACLEAALRNRAAPQEESTAGIREGTAELLERLRIAADYDMQSRTAAGSAS